MYALAALIKKCANYKIILYQHLIARGCNDAGYNDAGGHLMAKSVRYFLADLQTAAHPTNNKREQVNLKTKMSE